MNCTTGSYCFSAGSLQKGFSHPWILFCFASLGDLSVSAVCEQGQGAHGQCPDHLHCFKMRNWLCSEPSPLAHAGTRIGSSAEDVLLHSLKAQWLECSQVCFLPALVLEAVPGAFPHQCADVRGFLLTVPSSALSSTLNVFLLWIYKTFYLWDSKRSELRVQLLWKQRKVD